MSKSIFISSADTFDVTVHYKEDGKRLKVLLEPEKKKVKEGEKEVEKIVSDSLTMTFKYPDFATSQAVMRNATSLDANGVPSVNFLALQNSLLYSLASSWDVKDDKGKPVVLNNDNISKLRVDIAKALVEAVMAEFSDGGLV